MTEEMQDFNNDSQMTAGEMLRAARTTGRRKREIPTISKQLCIREEFLEALESGDYTVLPEAVYILGFARNYAMELGLDADVIVAKIKQELGLRNSDLPAVHQSAPEKNEVTHAPVRDKISRKLGRVRDSKSCKFLAKHWLWIVGGVVAAVVIAVIFGMIFAAPDTNKEKSITVSEPVVKILKVEPQYKQPVREKFGVENRDDAEIVLQAIQESWVKVEDARGKTLFSRVLVPGDVYYVPANGKNKATFGNAGAIDIWVGGELAPKAGDANSRKTGIALDAVSLMGVKKSGK